MARRYADCTIEELEQMFEQFKDNRPFIAELISELNHRSTPRARQLKNNAVDQRTALEKRYAYDVQEVEVRELAPHAGIDRNNFGQTFKSLDEDEQSRLHGLYEGLRDRLLDLTLRNRMLNYSVKSRAKNQLQIIDEVLENAYRHLINDIVLKVDALPEPDLHPQDEQTDEFTAALQHAKVADIEYVDKLEKLVAEDADDDIAVQRLERELRDRLRRQLGMGPRPRRSEINRTDHARSCGINPSIDLPAVGNGQRHEDRSLQTLKYPEELEATMARIGDQARLAEQESGLSTLYLALGFLEWYESDESDKTHYAPLLLLPVRIRSQKILGKPVYSIEASAEAAETNISLEKLLERDFGRALPRFDTENEVDPVESFLQAVEDCIDGLKRWKMRRWMLLGHFAFSRIAIYEDTHPERWPAHPASHSLVGPLLSGYEAGDIDENLILSPADYDIENLDIERIAPILVQDADASQHSALIDVMKGKNLVIQGPPGTGKSQTITNVIANALGAKKSVLFLAEKQAALEVVKRRLERAGLGSFCLELHSDKATPRHVIEALDERLKLSANGSPLLMRDKLWQEARTQIKGYLDALHAEDKDSETVFSLIWKALRLQTDDPETVNALRQVELPTELGRNVEELPEILGRVDEYAASAERFSQDFGQFDQSPWTKTPPVELAPYDYEEFVADLRRLSVSADALIRLPHEYRDAGVDTLEELAALAVAAESMPERPAGEHIAVLAEADVETLSATIEAQAEVLNLQSEFSSYPQHIGISTDLLPVAKKLAASIPGGDANQTPRDFAKNAEAKIEKNERLIDLFQRMEPVFSALGVGRSDRVVLARAACMLCSILRLVPEPQWEWIGTRVTDSARARLLSVEHKAILAEEGELLSFFPNGGRGKWPPRSELAIAANTLERAGFSKFLSSLSGGNRAAHRLLESLGCPPSEPAPKRLRQLVAHLERVERFNVPDNETAIGAVWRGPATPFPAIDLSLDLRDRIEAELPQSDGVRGVKDRFFSLELDKLRLLASYDEVAKEVLVGLSQVELGSDSINQLTQSLKRSKGALEQALAVDPRRVLRPATVSIRILAAMAEHQERLDAAQSVVAGSILGQPVSAIGETPLGIEQLRRVAAWLDWIDSNDLPETLRDNLIGEEVEAGVETLLKMARDYNDCYSNYDGASAKCQHYGLRPLFSWPLPDVIAHVDALLAHEEELRDWQSLRRQRQVLEAKGLGPFLKVAGELDIQPTKLPVALTALLARQRVTEWRRASEILRTVTGTDLETKRQAFAQRDLQKIVSDRAMVKARLLERSPPMGNRQGPVARLTEMALIRNELPKQKRFVPVRSLLARAGTSLQTLKPCFMMSPLSLAKFLPSTALTFDVLVIDEASQMRPEDALGAMLRARQIVVVGDRHQLPPTSFFDRAQNASSEEEEEDKIDDESILERCQKVFNEVRSLKWHYRSRCESLIRFSNDEFYKKELITFPAAKPGAFSVDLLRVNGTYQARRNLVEAERIAEEAVEFMRHFARSDEDVLPTLGIVAVNTDQRDLISETLRKLASDDTLVEQYMAKAEEKGEPLFVKNLENVQGDERDFIFISMTYGPEPGQSRTKQRFGPINSNNGHRRLNVLFSRARIRIALFTSFGSEDVLPTETSRKGVHVLKRYLEYAETKGRAAIEGIGREPDSDFEVEVARRLRLHGYDVELQVGVTGYKIDIGVRNPDAPHTFLAGVECDGAQYHSSKSARDRDRLREDVLGGLGWRLLRVWSTDWFDNPDRETTRLIAKLEAVRNTSRPVYEDYGFKSGLYGWSDHGDVEPDNPGSAVVETEAAPISSLPTDSHLDLEEALHHSDDGLELLATTRKLTGKEVTSALRALRETQIRVRMEDWEPHRSILREGMIETFIQQRITEPDQWFKWVPQYLRTNTDPREKHLFLEQICEIVERME